MAIICILSASDTNNQENANKENANKLSLDQYNFRTQYLTLCVKQLCENHEQIKRILKISRTEDDQDPTIDVQGLFKFLACEDGLDLKKAFFLKAINWIIWFAPGYFNTQNQKFDINTMTYRVYNLIEILYKVCIEDIPDKGEKSDREIEEEYKTRLSLEDQNKGDLSETPNFIPKKNDKGKFVYEEIKQTNLSMIRFIIAQSLLRQKFFKKPDAFLPGSVEIKDYPKFPIFSFNQLKEVSLNCFNTYKDVSYFQALRNGELMIKHKQNPITFFLYFLNFIEVILKIYTEYDATQTIGISQMISDKNMGWEPQHFKKTMAKIATLFIGNIKKIKYNYHGPKNELEISLFQLKSVKTQDFVTLFMGKEMMEEDWMGLNEFKDSHVKFNNNKEVMRLIFECLMISFMLGDYDGSQKNEEMEILDKLVEELLQKISEYIDHKTYSKKKPSRFPNPPFNKYMETDQKQKNNKQNTANKVFIEWSSSFPLIVISSIMIESILITSFIYFLINKIATAKKKIVVKVDRFNPSAETVLNKNN